MAKKKSKKESQQPPKKTGVAPETESKKPFDFGGLPERNLKKNLGCG